MRQPVQPLTLRFRASAALAEKAAAHAQAEGMSLSEFVRHALRRELQEAA